MDFYYFSKQLDIWEEDLNSELKQVEKEVSAVVTEDKTGLFYEVYSKSLDGTVKICRN